MTSNRLVSVIIPVYNSAKYIADAIDSALAQTYKNYEIIVVDDGSTDNTKEIVTQYTIRHTPYVKYIYQENKGLSGARNTGIKNAKGEFIAFLDADDIWLPEKLEHQIKFMDSDNVGIVGCSGYTINEKGEILDNFINKNYPNKSLLLNVLNMKNVVSGGSEALVRKKCFDVMGIFDENLRSSEDWDMWLRISHRYDVIFVEKSLAKIRIRTNSMSSPSNAQKMLDSDLIVLGKLFQHTKNNVFLRRKSYSYRYFSASWAFYKSGDSRKAKRYILKSIYLYPFRLLPNKLWRYGLLFEIFLGKKMSRVLKEFILKFTYQGNKK